jgi:hypothetical protein
MARLPTWLIVAAVGALGALAAADALRPADESSRRTPVAETTAPNLEGILVVGPSCSVRAFRLPDLLELQAPRQTDCGGSSGRTTARSTRAAPTGTRTSALRRDDICFASPAARSRGARTVP